MAARIFCIIFSAILFTGPAFATSDDVMAKYTGEKQCGKKFHGSFEAGISNKCYSCPSGYKHAWWLPVESKHVCYKKKIAGPFARPKYRGKEGCKKGSHEYILTGKCYACPAGYKRNMNPGDPAKVEVCKVDKKALKKRYKASKSSGLQAINFLLKVAREPLPAPSAAELRSRVGTRNVDTPPTREAAGVTQYAGDRKRIDYMQRVLDDMPDYNSKHGTRYQTVSYVKTSGGALVIGLAKEWGYSMTRKSNGQLECRKIESKDWSAGLQVDADVAEGVGIHQYPIDDIAGVSKGYASAFTWFDSLFSWTTSGQPAIGLYWPSLTHPDGSMVADGGIVTSLGISAAYAHSTTSQSKTPIPCDVLVWGPDFNNVGSDSWVKESK